MFRLEAMRQGPGSWVRIVSTVSGRAIREWHGAAARDILDLAFADSGDLERISSGRKAAIRRVHLAAAALALPDPRARASTTDTGVGRRCARYEDPEAVRQALGRHGIRCTPPRLMIATCLLTSPEHLCIARLRDRLRQRGQRCSRATVYNTLNLFAAKGLVRAITAGVDRVFYDTVTRPHPHLYRTDTDTLEDLDPELMVPLLKAGRSAGLVTESIDVVVRARAPRRQPAGAANG